jgi:hypothetical protein
MRRARSVAGIAVTVLALLAPLAPVGATVDSQIRAAMTATKGYPHPPAAKAAGYALLKDANGVACIAMKGMGAMGVHYANGSLVDGRIQVRHPEALVYRFAKNGHLRLSALEYLVLRKVWRQHHPTGRPELFGHRFNFTKAGNRFGLPAYFSLHAWLWYDNPAGKFQMWNPRVHCPVGI